MSYKDAAGVIPWEEGNELPEDAVRRARGHEMNEKAPIEPAPTMDDIKRLEVRISKLERIVNLIVDDDLEELSKLIDAIENYSRRVIT